MPSISWHLSSKRRHRTSDGEGVEKSDSEEGVCGRLWLTVCREVMRSLGKERCSSLKPWQSHSTGLCPSTCNRQGMETTRMPSDRRKDKEDRLR